MRKIFLCHASEDKPVAERIHLSLLSAGYKVFYDEQSLPPGGDYHARIHQAILESDLFIFLITSSSIAPGRFTLTELRFARDRWPSPIGRVLPVNLQNVPVSEIPAYLTAATLFTIAGNPASEVRVAAERMLNPPRRSWWSTRAGVLTAICGGVAAIAALAVGLHEAGLLGAPTQVPANRSQSARGGIEVVQLNEPPVYKYLPEEREIASRISKLIIGIEKLADKRNRHALVKGASADDLRALLRDFATKPGFESLDPTYSGKTTAALVAESRRLTTDEKAASELDNVMAHLSGMDVWIDMRVPQNAPGDPRAVAGEVIRDFVIPRWRALDFYYLDCPPDSPFC